MSNQPAAFCFASQSGLIPAAERMVVRHCTTPAGNAPEIAASMDREIVLSDWLRSLPERTTKLAGDVRGGNPLAILTGSTGTAENAGGSPMVQPCDPVASESS
jgi:hypothetical protein